jgi:hypothetical protein
MVFDPTYPEIDMGVFKICDWREFYGNVKEVIPGHAPRALGKMVDIRMYVDSDHAGDKLTRRSRTGFFILVNGAPVMWLSKRQTTVETSVFGAEFVAMKQGMEALRGLRYKLRMLGVPISGPSFIYGACRAAVMLYRWRFRLPRHQYKNNNKQARHSTYTTQSFNTTQHNHSYCYTTIIRLLGNSNYYYCYRSTIARASGRSFKEPQPLALLYRYGASCAVSLWCRPPSFPSWPDPRTCSCIYYRTL